MVLEVSGRAGRQVEPELEPALAPLAPDIVEAILGRADQLLEELEQPLPVVWEDRRRMLD